jgi:hypothetical protein
MTARRLALLALAPALLLPAACKSGGPNPPTDTGVCYSLAEPKKGEYKFNVVARNVPDLEHCGANLEAMRIKFLSMGGNRSTMTGVYQGHYIFINHAGLFSSTELDGPQYPLLVRTGDGRLAVPGSVSNPQ